MQLVMVSNIPIIDKKHGKLLGKPYLDLTRKVAVLAINLFLKDK